MFIIIDDASRPSTPVENGATEPQVDSSIKIDVLSTSETKDVDAQDSPASPHPCMFFHFFKFAYFNFLLHMIRPTIDCTSSKG